MLYVKEHHGRGYIYSIQYHIVWCTKYRKKVLNKSIEQSVKEILKQIALEHKFSIVTMETAQDHIHLLVDCSPQHYIPNIMKSLKGISARHMFKFHPELREVLWGGFLWNPSYYVGTVSETTEEQIKRYINSQKERSD